jgi:hypothetical protein
MKNSYLLIKIHPVYVVGKSYNFFPIWVTELNNYISGITKYSEYKMVVIYNNPIPAYLVTGVDLPVAFPGQCKDESCSLSNNTVTREVIEGQYHWQSGYGFSYSISTKSPISHASIDLNDCINSNWIINKYLEFLTRFNSAYDDDLVLNMSFCMASSSIGRFSLSILQLACV